MSIEPEPTMNEFMFTNSLSLWFWYRLLVVGFDIALFDLTALETFDILDGALLWLTLSSTMLEMTRFVFLS